MNVAPVSSELRHPSSLDDGFPPDLAGLNSFDELDHLMDMHIPSDTLAAPGIDVNMPDASDEQILAARLRTETAQLLATLSSYPTLFSNMPPTPTSPSIDDVAMMDSTEPFYPSKVTPRALEEDNVSNLAGKGKGIFDFLEHEFVAPAQPEPKQTYMPDTPPTKYSDPFPALTTNTTNLASLVKRSAPHETSIDLPKRRRLSRLLISSSNKSLHPPSPTPNLTSTPRELRDQIYALALLKTDSETESPKRINLDKIKLPDLCLSSKTLLTEALPIYFAVNSFKGHLHMPHTYEHALDPISHHENYHPASICTKTLAMLEGKKDIAKAFAMRNIMFEVLDKDLAHFCTLEIEVWKRGGGGVEIKCEGGSEVGCEVVAESERVMIEGMKDNLEPVILEMMRRDGFEGLTIQDLKTLATRVVVPWKPEDEGMENDSDKAE